MHNPFNPFSFRTASPIVACITLSVFLAACARQGAPAGGPKDTQPPQLDTAGSTPNYSTRFDKRRIELKFDEWLVLSDASTQIVVSPPLAKRPEVKLKGKTVVLSFDKDEVLRPNTTYTINYGSAVRDFHENNPVKDLRFVFSTGDYIDSLFFGGAVTDAFTGDPVENVSVMLYENLSDTAVRKERPYYFARTNKTGLYEFKNLRAAAFRVVAIEDGDQNLKWDGENERIGFRDSTLFVHDSLRGQVNLKLFKNQPKFRLVNPNVAQYGLVKLGFNTPLDSFETNTIAPEGLRSVLEKSADSLLFWYDLPTVDTSWSLLFSNNAMPLSDTMPLRGHTDTILVKKLPRQDFLQNHRLGFSDAVPQAPNARRGKTIGAPPKPQAVKTIIQSAIKPASLQFNLPLAGFDTSLWLLNLDSTRLTTFSAMADPSNPKSLVLVNEWAQGKNYRLVLLPGAITDFWGAPNADTLQRNFNVLTDKMLGTLVLTLEKIRPGTPYLLQLLDGNNPVEERRFVADAERQKLTFKNMQVAAYTARLVEDPNGNGRWDTGSFEAHRQPERIFSKKLDALRANWELEVTFSTEGISEKKKKQ